MKILISVLVVVLIIGFMAQGVAFAFAASRHISEQEKMLNVPLEKGGFGNHLTKEDLQELQKIIDENGQAGGDHRNNGSHDPTELDRRLMEKGWPPKKIAAAKNGLQIHVLQDIVSSKVGQRINGYKITRLDKLRANYQLWKIRHGWGCKPIKKYSTMAPGYSPSGDYKHRFANKYEPSEISTFERVTHWFKAVIERLTTAIKNIYNRILNKFVSNQKVPKASNVMSGENSSTTKPSADSKIVKPVQGQKVFEQKAPKLPKAPPKIIQAPLEKTSTFFRVIGTASKWSMVISILYEGYSTTYEVYEMKMAGKTVHPSRLVARVCVGFLGGTAAGTALGVALVCIPVVGPIIAIIGVPLGAVLGSILSEQLFELIMPLHGANWLWTPLDFILGGILGSILGIIFGIPYGFRKGCEDIEPRKVIDWILLPLAPLRIADSVCSYMLKGFFRGGFIGSMLMLIVFTFI
jgi:hypothetical protein